MQIDAHMEFSNDWDESLVTQWKSLSNDMAILTVYPASPSQSLIDTGVWDSVNRPIMCEAKPEGSGKSIYMRFRAFDSPPRHSAPEIQFFWAAGFSFQRPFR